MEKSLDKYPHHCEIEVAWGEMDAALHVNNTIYLRYSETARIKYFDAVQFTVDTQNPDNRLGPILAEAQCKYKFPLTHPDTVTVATRLAPDSIDEFSFWIEQLVFSQKAQRIAAEIRTRIVCYDYQSKRKAAIPDNLKQRILAFEQAK